MSDSEDGQLPSPGAERSGDEDHDADSLYIKPPQANAFHQRDSNGSRRKEKTHKEKKHSKERKHKDRSSGRDRSSDMEQRGREHRRDEQRNDLDRYHHQRGSSLYERDEVLTMEHRRYQKQYERGGGTNNYQHYPQQSYHQQYVHRQRQDYYERSYHHGGNVAMDYHGGNRHHHQPYVKHGGGHVDYVVDVHRERRKYSYEQKDPESLEQDLRSRLLSKRNHYARGGESSGNDMESDHHYSRKDDERQHERSYEDQDRLERHHTRREKARDSVIEVLDSPEGVETTVRQRRKHKRRNKDMEAEPQVKRRTPEDPELLARRAKILAAEREKERRKETAREELQARRERRERNVAEAIDVLSPTAVAASVTAGLNVVVKRKKNDEEHSHVRKKLSKKSSDRYDENDSQSDEDDSENDSDTAVEIEEIYKRNKGKRTVPVVEADYSDAEEMQLPDSPLSTSRLSASPNRRRKKRKNKKQKHTKRASLIDYAGDEDSNEDHSSKSYSQNSSSSSSQAASRSSHRSRRSHSRSRSRSYSAASHSQSHSRSYSTVSRSRSRSHSRSRTEERAMRAEKANEDSRNDAKETAAEEKAKKSDAESPIRDEKGVPLPNYFPGVQGCRSVEEFQCLNRIEEGTYGVVYRAKDKRTSEIVALKRLKMEKEKEGFPITSLREINTLLKGQHPNIVTVREIVVGSNMDKIFIVMDYVEHDLKSLMETMKTRKQSFFPGEVKCLIEQLLRAVGHLHDNWILHRDLKTSNLLLSHKGILKVGDFGLAREYGSPLKKYTSLVVTLWYRAPELLLCTPEYSTPIDIWSVGCIFAEFLQMTPLFPGKTELDELNRIFKELGTPNEKIWPGFNDLPAVKNLQSSQFSDYPVSSLNKHFSDKTSEAGISLLQGLLTYDPKQRLNADKALKHTYFSELPLPIDPSMFPTWPAKSELGARKALVSSPKPPSGGSQFKQLGRDDIISASGSHNKVVSGIITGNKKTATNTGFVLNAGIDQRQFAMGPGFSLKF